MKKRILVTYCLLMIALITTSPFLSAVEYTSGTINGGEVQQVYSFRIKDIVDDPSPGSIIRLLVEIFIILSFKSTIRGFLLTLVTSMKFKQAYLLSFIISFIAAFIFCKSAQLYAQNEVAA